MCLHRESARQVATNASRSELTASASLRDLGYVEGRNVVIEYRDAEGKRERLPALAAELVALKVDVIFVGAGTRVAFAPMQATKTIPIVFTDVGDPVESGLVTNLARPGGNVTGVSSLGPELVCRCRGPHVLWRELC